VYHPALPVLSLRDEAGSRQQSPRNNRSSALPGIASIHVCGRLFASINPGRGIRSFRRVTDPRRAPIPIRRRRPNAPLGATAPRQCGSHRWREEIEFERYPVGILDEQLLQLHVRDFAMTIRDAVAIEPRPELGEILTAKSDVI
jgi:hypothetical protein